MISRPCLLTPNARSFAQTFVKLQELRHEADYNHYASFTRRQVLTWIQDAREAVAALRQEPQRVQNELTALMAHRARTN